MNETIYDIHFDWHNINPSNFKQRMVSEISTMIGAGRMCEFFKFNGYARIDFHEDDVHHFNPFVEVQDKFNRTKTNCLIFDMPINNANRGYYDKMFLYHVNGTSVGNFGYVLYNTTTGKCTHKNYVDDAVDELVQSLAKTVNNMRRYDIHAIYHKKNNEIKTGKCIPDKEIMRVVRNTYENYIE